MRGWSTPAPLLFCALRRDFPESDGGKNPEQNENNEDDKLGDFERRFRLGGREGFKRGDFQETLDDEDEEVQIKRDDGGDDISHAPAAGEFARVTRIDRHGQNNEGNDADAVRGHEVMDGKKESRNARQSRGDKKKGVPRLQVLAGDHPKNDNKARQDGKETDGDVEQCVSGEQRAFVGDGFGWHSRRGWSGSDEGQQVFVDL